VRIQTIGFSIAGSMISAEIARRGFEVKAYEEHRNPYDKIECSGLISENGYSAVSKYFSMDNIIENWIRGAKVFIGEEWFELKRSHDIAYVIDRKRLNEASAKNAERKGVEVEYGKRKTALEIRRMEYAIGADGPWSETALAFHYPKIKKYIYSMHTDVGQVWEKDIVRIYMDDRFRGFFGWIIPHRKFSEIGFGTVRREDAKRGIEFFNGVAEKAKWRGAVIPVKLREKLQDRNSILVGDAAGMTKRTTGGGITFMSTTLPWFADAIEGKCNIDERIRNSNIMGEMVAHSAIQRISEMSGENMRRLMYYALELSGGMDVARENGDMDFPMKMIGL